MKTMIVLAAMLLTGCSNTRWLENRVACTVDGKEAHVVSKWGPVGIAAQVAQADAQVLCRKV
jgi:hypothetical protein